MRFYLGTHKPAWLGKTTVPLMVSRRTLAPRRSLPVAKGRVAIDSAGFTELSMYGEWRTSPQQYVGEVRRFVSAIGNVDWAAPQDWMCEPPVLDKTGLTVREHQERTVANFLLLRDMAPDLPFIPVLQGWKLEDYLTCARLYEQAGVKLENEHTVGVGSICRRQATGEITAIVMSLSHLRLHCFGVKMAGLTNFGPFIRSADSGAWGHRARWSKPLEGHTHKNCANCIDYALWWRGEVMRIVNTPRAIQGRFA